MSELSFQRQDPVRWLMPPVLVTTGIKSVLAGIFGSYADKRELQRGLPSTVHSCDGEELWFDFVADVGDGFNATFSIASLLAAPELRLDEKTLPRGRILIMGGDEVYPSASAEAYEDRTKGPYRAALPAAEDHPRLFALPGNHDWYDGLTSFLRTFAQQRNIGGWQTEQSRSYFAIELPQRWWLFAVDTQFDQYIDGPQLEYFREAAKNLREGDAVILCTPVPTWAHAPENYRGYDIIQFFEHEIVRPAGAVIRVMLSGDSHHYARYEGTCQRITCGGGGAYLSATHRLHKTIELPPKETRIPEPDPVETIVLRETYPSEAESKSLANGIFRLPWTNPGFWGLTAVLQTVLALFLQIGLTVHPGGAFGEISVWAPAVFMIVLVVLMGVLFARYSPPGGARTAAGLIHAAAHLVLAGLWAWFLFWLNGHADGWVTGVVGIVGTFAVIGFLDAEIVALYLLLASRWGVNLNEAFAGQSIQDYKSFLRMHITTGGDLEIFPVKVPRVCRDWKINEDRSPGAPWIVPQGELKAELIEKITPVTRVPTAGGR
ncbi:metallophosphoesterase [Actinocrispum sp. NPDC049592]|uniref:metallophosphoesterase family protein n=1 Tax=Actinocrispum sp. NPDC049592 TaxID=3154835 RepID=UPI0034144122